MKHAVRVLLALCLALAIPTTIRAFDFDDDDFGFDVDLSGPDELAGVDLDGVSATRQPCDVKSAYEQLATLLALPGATAEFVEILKRGVYNQTNIPHSRYIGDMPSFIVYNNQQNFFSIELFGNYMPRARFTKDCETLDSYIAITDDNIVREIKKFSELFNVPSAAQALRLFAQFNLTEARSGIMLQGRKSYRRWAFGAQLPLYYYIRHYNASEDIREDLKRFLASFNGTEEPGQASGSTSKLKKLAVGDTWGLGDLRFDASRLFYASDCMRFIAGGRATLDLHSAFGRGLIGSNFKNQPIPLLDLEVLMCNIDQWIAASRPSNSENLRTAKRLTKNWAVDVLNWASQSLLFPDLNETTSVGAFLESHITLNHQITVKSRLNADWLFPKNGTRYILATRDTSNFTTEYVSTLAANTLTEEQATRRFSYLTELLQEKFAPDRACVKLGSRKKFEWSIAPYIRIFENLTAHMGYDFWWIDGDSIKSVNGDFVQHFDIVCPTGDCTTEQVTVLKNETLPIEVKKALRGSAYQSKLFGGIEYRKFRERSDLSFSLAGDYTIGRRWIGDDWTLKFAMTWQF